MRLTPVRRQTVCQMVDSAKSLSRCYRFTVTRTQFARRGIEIVCPGCNFVTARNQAVAARRKSRKSRSKRFRTNVPAASRAAK